MKLLLSRRLALTLPLAAVGCAGSPILSRGANAVQPGKVCDWIKGDSMAAKDSNGEITFLRAPVVHENGFVLAAMQKYGPLPGMHGDRLMEGVDQGLVQPYRGPGMMVWYFHADIGMPTELPYTDVNAMCLARSPVVPSEKYRNWVCVRTPPWARLNVPTRLLLAGPVAVRARDIPVVHVPEITEGSFIDTTDIVVGLPGRIRELVAEGRNGVRFFFIV